jgi:hypothetical protein
MRLAVLVICLIVSAAPLGGAPEPVTAGGERVELTVDEAVKLAFPKCETKKSTVYLTEEQERRVAKLAGTPLGSAIARPIEARKDGKLVGTAYVDAHKVRTMKETLFVVVDPDGKVARIELLAFAEPEEYAPRGKWYAQFLGRSLDDELQLKRGIRGIAGASLSARATTDAVRRVLALHKVLSETDR